MQQPFQHIKKCILLFVALQILNIGLFAQDIVSNNTISQSQNIIHSATEYIAEVVLNKVNYFSENKKNNNHQHHKNHHNLHIKAPHIKLCNNNVAKAFTIISLQKRKLNFASCNDVFFANIVFDITPPPPKC